MVESAWAEDIGQFLYYVVPDTRKNIIKNNKQCPIGFKKTCMNIYIYIYPFLHAISFSLLFFLFLSSSYFFFLSLSTNTNQLFIDAVSP